MLDGQPPFDTIMITKDLLIAQMAEEIGALPDRWKDRWDSSEMDGESDESLTLEQWLAELYFDDDKEAQMSKAEVQDWAAMLRKLLIFEPAERASAADILRDGDLD